MSSPFRPESPSVKRSTHAVPDILALPARLVFPDRATGLILARPLFGVIVVEYHLALRVYEHRASSAMISSSREWQVSITRAQRVRIGREGVVRWWMLGFRRESSPRAPHAFLGMSEVADYISKYFTFNDRGWPLVKNVRW